MALSELTKWKQDNRFYQMNQSTNKQLDETIHIPDNRHVQYEFDDIDNYEFPIQPEIETEFFNEGLTVEIETFLSSLLTKREIEILKLYYGFEGKELSLEEIGEKFDLTRERVRQTKYKSLKTLKKFKNELN